ncbi:hypothetical protein BBJ28_00025157 [Nothophytophthora sp. Chile5]|nr:hypothetical protein BBJ28_00025157 [Nothophytophthora sp. Chile5]
MQKSRTTNRKQLDELLGSLRHVTMCVRVAGAFFQRISTLSRRAHQFASVEVTSDVLDDLRWFAAILRIGRLNAVPLTRFVQTQTPDFHIHMDASDRGLCALFPAVKQYVQVEFDDEERAQIALFNESGAGVFGINIRELMSAVFAAVHSAGYDPGVNASHAILLRGILRFTNPVTKQHPVDPAFLRLIQLSLDLRRPRDQLLWGGLLLAYFFLLRRSEYLFIGRKHHQYVLRLGSIVFQDVTGKNTLPRRATIVGIRLTGAKNNQFGREEARYHHRSGDKILCPVKAARWILKGAQAFKTRPDQPALAMGASSGISAEDVAAKLKSTARAASLDPTVYSTHSIRIGGATRLLNAGADRLVIKLMGRWLSNAFEEYPVLTSEGSKDLAQLMCS